MGLRETLRLIDGATALQESSHSSAGIRSPWTVGQLSQIVWSDILGAESLPVTRAEAMAIPAIARGRHLLVTTVARLPMWTYRQGQQVPQGPQWLYRTNLGTSIQHRLAMTVDDLIFTGWSLWAVERDDTDAITDAGRIPAEWWHFDDDGNVVVQKPGQEEAVADNDAVILIPGFHEGIINSASRTIRGARELETQWAQRAANPIPALELHQTDNTELLDEEIVAMVEDWKTAMSDQGGAVAYTPSSIELRPHGTAATDLLIQGRNAAAVDAARILGISASLIDATGVNATLKYETQQGTSSDFYDFSVPLYTDPISARLSLDDVTPPGTWVGFDYAALPPNRRQALED